jgi:hypothetical protein
MGLLRFKRTFFKQTLNCAPRKGFGRKKSPFANMDEKTK